MGFLLVYFNFGGVDGTEVVVCVVRVLVSALAVGCWFVSFFFCLFFCLLLVLYLLCFCFVLFFFLGLCFVVFLFWFLVWVGKAHGEMRDF